MKNLTKTIATGIFAVAFIGVVFADTMTTTPSDTKTASMLPLHKAFFQPFNFQKSENDFTGSWFKALHHVKQLTSEQAKTVAQAAVILYGDSDMQVGNITAVAGEHGQQNYQIQITNTTGETLATLLMNGNNGKILPPMHN